MLRYAMLGSKHVPGLSFVRDMSFKYGALSPVAPGLRRLVIPNPSTFTHYGTGVYVIGEGEVAVIDPGPAEPAYTHGLLAALSGETVEAIFVTHTHLDHSPAAAVIKQETGATTYGYGPHGRGTHMESRQAPAAIVEEGADFSFVPDHALQDCETIEGASWTLTALHTPGHTSNHLCYSFPLLKALFTGDHVMGWSTTVVSAPDGDMTQYMASLKKLIGRPETVYYPTHGPEIREPQSYVEGLIAHRLQREQQILDQIRGEEGATVEAIVEVLYADVPRNLHRAAGCSVASHLQKLCEEGSAHIIEGAEDEARYRAS